MRRSVFSPCPMGNVNLDCYRPYEALQYGSVPILEKRAGLDYFTALFGSHPIPTFRTWREAARFVESSQHDYAAQDRLISQCSEWWRGYKRDLSSRIAQFIEEPHGNAAGPAVRWQRSIPGAQGFELMRHHSFPALLRRAKLMASRMAKGGRSRKTAGT